MDQINSIQSCEPALLLYIPVGVHVVSKGVVSPQPYNCAFKFSALASTVLTSSNQRTTNHTALIFYIYGH